MADRITLNNWKYEVVLDRTSSGQTLFYAKRYGEHWQNLEYPNSELMMEMFLEILKLQRRNITTHAFRQYLADRWRDDPDNPNDQGLIQGIIPARKDEGIDKGTIRISNYIADWLDAKN